MLYAEGFGKQSGMPIASLLLIGADLASAGISPSTMCSWTQTIFHSRQLMWPRKTSSRIPPLLGTPAPQSFIPR